MSQPPSENSTPFFPEKISLTLLSASITLKSAHLPCVKGVTKPSIRAASAFLWSVFPVGIVLFHQFLLGMPPGYQKRRPWQ
jgi:hypothetical protein